MLLNTTERIGFCKIDTSIYCLISFQTTIQRFQALPEMRVDLRHFWPSCKQRRTQRCVATVPGFTQSVARTHSTRMQPGDEIIQSESKGVSLFGTVPAVTETRRVTEAHMSLSVYTCHGLCTNYPGYESRVNLCVVNDIPFSQNVLLDTYTCHGCHTFHQS
jgi:hypothetical protein